MPDQQLPTIILGGSDRKSTRLPDGSEDKHPLSGYKGVDIRLGGRPMIEVIVERLKRVGCFNPIYIAGPAKVYDQVQCDASLIDANGSFGQNIQASMESVRAVHAESPIGFITCDVLPEVDSLRELMADYSRSDPPHATSGFRWCRRRRRRSGSVPPPGSRCTASRPRRASRRCGSFPAISSSSTLPLCG